MQLKNVVSFHWATVLFSTVTKTHGASFEVWFGFTRMEHLNFNCSVETSFSKCLFKVSLSSV